MQNTVATLQQCVGLTGGRNHSDVAHNGKTQGLDIDGSCETQN